MFNFAFLRKATISLFLRSKGRTIGGQKLREELKDKPVLNGCVLDYLLAHPHLIPEEWKRDDKGRIRHIFFWGTIYRHPVGNLFVRYLVWGGDRWRWRCRWLEGAWRGQDPAAVRAGS